MEFAQAIQMNSNKVVTALALVNADKVKPMPNTEDPHQKTTDFSSEPSSNFKSFTPHAVPEVSVAACICQSEEETAVLTLYDNGTICQCNQAAVDLFGCAPTGLTWLPVSKFLPQLADKDLMQGESINPKLRFLSHIGYGFEMIAFSGVPSACMLFFNEVQDLGRHCLRLIIRPVP